MTLIVRFVFLFSLLVKLILRHLSFQFKSTCRSNSSTKML